MGRIREFVLVVIVVAFGAAPVLTGRHATPAADDLQATIAVLEAGAASTPRPTMAPGEVIRTVLSRGLPASAPGQALELVRYTIAPDSHLPAHTHPGMQVSYIESGTLTYTVVAGEATYTRTTADGTVAETGTLVGGQTAELGFGTSLIEPEGMVHFGENLGDEPVVILVASLFQEGAPPSTIVEVATPAAATPAA